MAVVCWLEECLVAVAVDLAAQRRVLRGNQATSGVLAPRRWRVRLRRALTPSQPAGLEQVASTSPLIVRVVDVPLPLWSGWVRPIVHLELIVRTIAKGLVIWARPQMLPVAGDAAAVSDVQELVSLL